MKTVSEALTHWLADQSDDDLRDTIDLVADDLMAAACTEELIRRAGTVETNLEGDEQTGG